MTKAATDEDLKVLGLEGVRASIERAHLRIDELTEALACERNGLKNLRECERAMTRPTRDRCPTPGLYMHWALNGLPNGHPRMAEIRARARLDAEAFQRENGLPVTG